MSTRSPAAIVGFGFRVPGASTLRQVAAALLGNEPLRSVVPSNRIDPDKYYDPAFRVGDPKIDAKLGGCLEEASGPELAQGTHGWLLDAAADAVRSSKLSPDELEGLSVPVIVGSSRGGGRGLYDAALFQVASSHIGLLEEAIHPEDLTQDQIREVASESLRVLRGSLHPSMEHPDQHAVTTLASIVADAYRLTGPITIADGNCTSGLLAVDMAMSALDRGAPFAFAGALSFIDTSNQVLYSNARILSDSGHEAFSKRGAGTLVSDAAVFLLLEPLEAAQRHGRPIHGVIRSVEGANDGAGTRFMLTPRADGHALAMTRAYERASLDPRQIDLFLAHGSGTRLGAISECNAFRMAIESSDRAGELRPIPCRSVKHVFGHTREASGLVNVLAAMALAEAGRIPAGIVPADVRPEIDVGTSAEVGGPGLDWSNERPRVSVVSAIASGGQNYHAVWEDKPSAERIRELTRSSRPASAVPVAIVGIACRFPGADTPEQLWANLMAGRREFSGSSGGRAASLSLQVKDFRARYRQYSERAIDVPRYPLSHFLMTDLAGEACRDSGMTIRDRRRVAVVLAHEHASEFGLRQVAATRLPEVEHALRAALERSSLGSREVERALRDTIRELSKALPEVWRASLFNLSPSFVAARIARSLDVHGPSCAVESGGGASSMSALQLACDRLATEECDTVFWSAADLGVGPVRSVAESKLGLLSSRDFPTVFQEGTDGYLLGEGAIVFVLRRLEDAKRDGNKIHGVVRAVGSAYEKAGALGVSADAMASAINDCGAVVDLERIALVEAFGCGVEVADRCELSALERVGVRGRAAALPIGAVMPNVGHTRSAAGALALLKALWSLRERVVPPTAGFEGRTKLGPNLEIAGLPTRLPDSASLAGVNALGLNGNHYHVVVQAPGV
jgi:acyl transferase domain-containing protein